MILAFKTCSVYSDGPHVCSIAILTYCHWRLN